MTIAEREAAIKSLRDNTTLDEIVRDNAIKALKVYQCKDEPDESKISCRYIVETVERQLQNLRRELDL